jgi:hypothetical protein
VRLRPSSGTFLLLSATVTLLASAGGAHRLAASPRRPEVRRGPCALPHRRSIAISLPEQLRQPRDVDGDPSRLVVRELLGLSRFGFVFPRIEGRRAPGRWRLGRGSRRTPCQGAGAGESGVIRLPWRRCPSSRTHNQCGFVPPSVYPTVSSPAQPFSVKTLFGRL